MTSLKLRLPWMRVTDKPNRLWLTTAARLIVEYAGAEWVGVQEGVPGQESLAMFNVPNGSTLSLPLLEVSVAAVREKLEES